jgi:hypothetical protein
LAEELLAMARRAAAHCKLHVGADMIACFSWAARDFFCALDLVEVIHHMEERRLSLFLGEAKPSVFFRPG